MKNTTQTFVTQLSKRTELTVGKQWQLYKFLQKAKKKLKHSHASELRQQNLQNQKIFVSR